MDGQLGKLRRLHDQLPKGRLREVLRDALWFLLGDERPLQERAAGVLNEEECDSCERTRDEGCSCPEDEHSFKDDDT